MDNKLQATTLKLNADGNQIVDEAVDGGGKTQTIKYGMIKMMGEKNEHRISYKTLLAINEAQNAKFQGKINIPEINMRVAISQVVMMRSETETVRVENSITNLPTTNVILDLDFNISPYLRPYFLRNRIPYYEAVVHYIERDGKPQYYLEIDKIKRLVKVEFDSDGYDFVTDIYHYGVKQVKVV